MIDLRLCGAVPSLCDIVQEGYLNVWHDESDRTWKLVGIKIQNRKFHIYNSSDKKFLFHIEFTDDMKVCESTMQREYSFQVRYCNQRKG